MLSGNWKDFDELEIHISYPELVLMVQAQRDKEHREFKMSAALQGVDIDKDKKRQQEDPVERAKRRVRARQMGISEDELKFKENVKAAGFAHVVKK